MATKCGLPVGLLVCCFFCGANAVVEISLNGEWTVTNLNRSIEIPATVPGGIYTDLQKQGLIGEPYYGFNDVAYEWVGRENWTFKKKFNVPRSLLDERRVTLVAHGIDTVCSVSLNGVLLFRAKNMFVRYTADVTKQLKDGINNIEVKCESPVHYAKRKHEQRTRTSYPVYPLCPPEVQHGQCHVNLIRKMPCSFSWDWGPSFPSSGIWKSIELQGYSGIVIRDVLVTTHVAGPFTETPPWTVNVTVFYESSLSKEIKARFYVELDGSLLKYGTFTAESAGVLEPNLTFQVEIPALWVKPWWPSGYGEQNLYNLTITAVVDWKRVKKTTRVGFRFVELNEDPVAGSDGGKEFYFKVNGVPIYAKGSNWIPAHVLPERVTAEYVTDLLLSAKEANMNMLRVWGGGIYESDHFYDKVDELGLLIWQDMMFASSQYPGDSEFLKNVEVEVTQQVRRLQHHPSVIVWAANNENEETIGGGYWSSDQKYREDYRKLYIGTILRVVEREDPSRPFLPSSPSNGRVPPTFSGFHENPESRICGDTHYYGYEGNAWDPSSYPVSRFLSEHGIQSYPFKDTLLPVAPESSITYPFSEFLEHRQHAAGGALSVLEGIREKFDAPALSSADPKAYDAVSYLSQVYQAMAIRTVAETYRRWRSYLRDGIGHNMGFLYWQLNGIWQAPSWASIDYGGHWRMLHYYAKKFFSPVIVSPYIEGALLKVYVINDNLNPIKNAKLTISQYNWARLSPVHSRNIRIEAPAAASSEVLSDRLDGRSNASFLWFKLSNTRSKSSLAPETFLLLDDTSRISLPKPSIKVIAVSGPRLSALHPGMNVFVVHLQTDSIAAFVWLSAGKVTGHFSDNGFLLKRPRTIVEFYTNAKLSAKDFKRTLTINSLADYVK